MRCSHIHSGFLIAVGHRKLELTVIQSAWGARLSSMLFILGAIGLHPDSTGIHSTWQRSA